MQRGDLKKNISKHGCQNKVNQTYLSFYLKMGLIHLITLQARCSALQKRDAITRKRGRCRLTDVLLYHNMKVKFAGESVAHEQNLWRWRASYTSHWMEPLHSANKFFCKGLYQVVWNHRISLAIDTLQTITWLVFFILKFNYHKKKTTELLKNVH